MNFRFLLLLLPLTSSLYIFDNMIEPYIKEPIPSIFLSPNETYLINLKRHYGGSQITFKFDAFTDPYIDFSYTEGISISSNKPITDTPIEILLFSDQNNYNVSGAILTDENKIISILMSNIYDLESEIHFIKFSNLPTDLSCKRMTKINYFSVLLDCNSRNESLPPQFLVIEFFPNSTISSLQRINNSYNCPCNQTAYRDCIRTIRYDGKFLYRFCKKSENGYCGSLEIFSFNFSNMTSQLYRFISNIANHSLSIQDLQIYGQRDIFILDYHFGLFEVQFDETSLTIIQNDCPNILGGNYYVLNFDCFDQEGIHNDLDQCKLIVTSSHYISELTFSKNFGSYCYLYSRKNLGDTPLIIHQTYFANNYLILYYSSPNNQSYFLNVYDRKDLNTNILYQMNLSSPAMVSVMTGRTNLYFSSNLVSKLIVFTNIDHQFFFTNIGQNIVRLSCCNPFPLDPLHKAQLGYSVLDLNKKVYKKDQIFIKTIKWNDQNLFAENKTYSFNISLSFLQFEIPLLGILKGPNQQFDVQFERDLKYLILEIHQNNSIVPPILDNLRDFAFLKLAKINLNFFFFIQYQNYSVQVQKCSIENEGSQINPSTMLCWNVSHEIQPEGLIEEVIIKEDIIIVKTKLSNLLSFYFEDQRYNSIIYDGIYTTKNQSLKCPIFLFSLISSHCLCISYDPQNNFLVSISIFNPTNSKNLSKTDIFTYNYTNKDNNYTFRYFDTSLLSNDIILGKGPHCIHILQITNDSLATVTVIDNEFTEVQEEYQGYHFIVIKSILHEIINLLIINYEKNIIAEFILDDLIAPIFSRKYSLFNYVLDKSKINKTIALNDVYLIVPCVGTIQGENLYLIFDVFKSTESNLVKIIPCANSCELFFILERNYILNQFSPEALKINFLIINKTQMNLSTFNLHDPAALKGILDIKNIERSLFFNESNKTYAFTTNFIEEEPFFFNISVSESLLNNNTPILLNYNLSFDYSDNIIGYSEYLLENPNKNLTILDLSESNSTVLPPFFNGPVLSYLMENDKSVSSSFIIKTYMDFRSQWNIEEKLMKFRNITNGSSSNLMFNMHLNKPKIKLIQKANLSKKIDYNNTSSKEKGDEITFSDIEFKINSSNIENINYSKNKNFSNEIITNNNLMIVPTDDYLFILSSSSIYMLRISTIENNDKFNLIDIFDLNNITDLETCTSFESNNDIIPYLYLGCKSHFKKPLLFILEYTNEGFNKKIREVIINEILDDVNSLKIIYNLIFIINQKSDCSIFIFQIDIPLANSTAIPLTNLYILNAQSFNVDYLLIFDFELFCLGTLNESMVYGIILNDQYALYYCEISINPNIKIIDFYNRSISDFILKSNTQLNKLDLSSLLNTNYRIGEGFPSIKSYFIELNVFGEFFILISTVYQLMEIKTSRFYFSGHYEVNFMYQEYTGCLNDQKINSRFTKNPLFLAFPCILSNNYSPYQTYIKLYSKNISYIQTNNAIKFLPIVEIKMFPSSKFNDFFLVSNKEGDTSLFVINGTEILEYQLSQEIKIERVRLNRSIAGHEYNHLSLTAYNIFSKAKVVMNVNNGFFIQNDWKSFFFLILAPLVFCLIGMGFLFAAIKLNKLKRRNMLLKFKE